MAVGNRLRCGPVALLFLLALPAPGTEPDPRGSAEPTLRVAQQYPSGQEGGSDPDEDRWKEESERINRLKFRNESNWNEADRGGGSGDARADAEPASVQRLRMEGEKRLRAERLAWRNRAEEIREKWGCVRSSSPTTYVVYTETNDAFGGIDYEKGLLEVGAIAPVFFQDGPAKIEWLLYERLSFLLRSQSMPGMRDLENQIGMPGTGRVITKAEVQQFSRYMARSGGPPQSYTAPDGVRRLRKEIRLELVPDHLQARVRQYLPYVEKAARIYEVDPELILAVIETESVFNPRAVSHAGAVGLMQLVPTSGALEASKLVYGEPRLLTREELSRPDKNIELGAAYLRILLNRYFGTYTTEPRKRLFLAIASYNCGPRCVKKALGGQDTRRMSPAEFYDLLLGVVPRETRVYLQRVVRNMKQYESIRGRAPGAGFGIAGFPRGLPGRVFLRPVRGGCPFSS